LLLLPRRFCLETMLSLYLLTGCVAWWNLRELNSTAEFIEWNSEADISVLGLFSNYSDSKNIDTFLKMSKHLDNLGFQLAFALTEVEEIWDMYGYDIDDTSVLLLIANYDDDDAEWRGRDNVITYQGNWELSSIEPWVVGYSFPPVVHINEMAKVGGDVESRANFLLTYFQTKMMWLHSGLQTPKFFVKLGGFLRGDVFLVVWDVSEEETLLASLPERGWRLIIGRNVSSIWDEYEGRLDEKSVRTWTDDVVLGGLLQEKIPFTVDPEMDERQNQRIKNAKKRMKEESIKKQQDKLNRERWRKEWAEEGTKWDEPENDEEDPGYDEGNEAVKNEL